MNKPHDDWKESPLIQDATPIDDPEPAFHLMKDIQKSEAVRNLRMLARAAQILIERVIHHSPGLVEPVLKDLKQEEARPQVRRTRTDQEALRAAIKTVETIAEEHRKRAAPNEP